MKRNALTVLTIAALTTLSTTALQADTINVAYKFVDAGGQQVLSGSTSYNGANGLQTIDLSTPVGSLASQLPTRAYAFCVELGQDTDFPFTSYNAMPLTSYTSADKAALLSQLYAQHYQSSWGSDTAIYYGGSFGGYTSGQPANTTENAEALAFCTLVYEIQYDFTGSLASLNLSSGNIIFNSSNPASATTIAANWLAALQLPADYTGPLTPLVALASPTHQDLVIPVPEPTSIAFVALGGIALLRRRHH